MKKLKVLLSYLNTTAWISLGILLLSEALRQKDGTIVSICLVGIFFLTNGITSLVDTILLQMSQTDNIDDRKECRHEIINQRD